MEYITNLIGAIDNIAREEIRIALDNDADPITAVRRIMEIHDVLVGELSPYIDELNPQI